MGGHYSFTIFTVASLALGQLYDAPGLMQMNKLLLNHDKAQQSENWVHNSDAVNYVLLINMISLVTIMFLQHKPFTLES